MKKISRMLDNEWFSLGFLVTTLVALAIWIRHAKF